MSDVVPHILNLSNLTHVPHILNLSNLTYVTSTKYIYIVQTPRVLQWSRTAILHQESPSHHGTEKTDSSIEESEMSANQRHKLASETEEERAARLQQMSAMQPMSQVGH